MTQRATTTGDVQGQVVLGAMFFGTHVDRDRSFEVLDAFVEAGGVWVDTSDCYAFWADPSGVGGASEQLLGDWLATTGARERVLISTKVGQDPLVPHRWPESAEGLSSHAIRTAVAGSLKRLGVDSVDLLWAHAEDRSVALEEQVATFAELVEAGAAHRVGLSNHAAWRVERARAIARRLGAEPCTAIQLRYSYVQPRPGAPLDAGHVHAGPDALDHAASEGLAVWAYTAMMNGAYVRADKPLPESYDHPGTRRRLAALADVAEETGATRGQVVLSWLMGGRPAMSPIVGASRPEQIREALAAQDLSLTPDQRRRLDEAA